MRSNALPININAITKLIMAKPGIYKTIHTKNTPL